MSKVLLSKAIALAARAFENKYDKHGEPYILHCIRVMNSQTTDKRRILGILHDILEDTNISEEELMAEGFGLAIIVPLKLLTHDQVAKTYEEFIQEISMDDDARAVKLADLEDNMRPSRLKGLTKSDFARMEKYQRAYVYLSKV